MSSWRLTENKRLFSGSGEELLVSSHHPLPFLIPSSPLIFPIPSSLIFSSCHPTTSSLYPSSLQFFNPSSTHSSSAPPLLGLIPYFRVSFWSVWTPSGLGHVPLRPGSPLCLPTASHIDGWLCGGFLQMKKSPKHFDAGQGWCAEYRWPSIRHSVGQKANCFPAASALLTPNLWPNNISLRPPVLQYDVGAVTDGVCCLRGLN